MVKKYKTYPEAVYAARVLMLRLLAQSPRLRLFAYKLFSGSGARSFTIRRYLQRSVGFYTILRLGDTVVQCGVSMDTPNSQVFDIARAVGSGKIVHSDYGIP